MKAIQKDGAWEKSCCKCKTLYNCISIEGFREFAFSRDIDTPDGLARVCKACMAAYNKQDKAKRGQRARAKRQRAKEKLKNRARMASARHYKGLGFKCAVLNCDKHHDQLHHINYNDYLAVIPLCFSHHADAHTIPAPIESDQTGS